jgi:hypothetical protein
MRTIIISVEFSFWGKYGLFSVFPSPDILSTVQYTVVAFSQNEQKVVVFYSFLASSRQFGAKSLAENRAAQLPFSWNTPPA